MGAEQLQKEAAVPLGPPVVTNEKSTAAESHVGESHDIARIRTLVGTAPVVLFTVDTDLRYTWVHHANSDLRCVDPVGKRDDELFHIADEAKCLEELKREVLRSGRAMRVNIHLTPRQKRYYFDLSLQPELDASGKVIGIAGFAVDVTNQVVAERAQRSAEKALIDESRRRDERQRLVGMATNDVIWDLDLSNMKIDWSEATERVIGYRPEELPAFADWSERIHPEDRPRVLASVDEALLGKARTWSAEYRFARKDGRYIVVLDRCVIARDEFGKAYRLVGSLLDLTERRNFEEALEQSKAEAEAASDAKEWFLAVLSHELRTPLTPVLTAAQILAQETLTTEQVRELAAVIRRNVELETRLMDDLLDHTRIRRGKLQLRTSLTDVHEAIFQALEIVRPEAASRGIGIVLRLDAPQTGVMADPARLQQVLWNLLKNAIKFTKSGGTIAIGTALADDGMIEVSVTDNGMGINPDELSSIFEAFKQGRGGEVRQAGGLGLGLAISRGLIELHGGKIVASSEGPGKGATFSFAMPAYLGESSAVAEPREPIPADATRQRILLVEDDGDTARLMGRILRHRGHVVRIADSVAAALREAAMHEFDVLLSDIGLPDGSGLDLMRQLQVERPIKGIVMSGYGMEDDLRRSREAGFHAHLTKPVTVQQLSAALAAVARESAGQAGGPIAGNGPA